MRECEALCYVCVLGFKWEMQRNYYAEGVCVCGGCFVLRGFGEDKEDDWWGHRRVMHGHSRL